jgi:hypothetical protein
MGESAKSCMIVAFLEEQSAPAAKARAALFTVPASLRIARFVANLIPHFRVQSSRPLQSSAGSTSYKP